MTQGNYASVNGLQMYYETYGTGKPLILMHGGMGVIGMFADVLPALAENRQVIAIELEAHGRTRALNRAMSFEQMADDIAALIQQLGFEKADMMGYSLGGGVALQTAIRHPEVIRKLALVSTAHKSDAWYSEMRAAMKMINAESAQAWVGSPMHQAYVSVAPDPQGWTTLVSKTGKLVAQDYDWSEAVALLKMPTLIVMGDADGISPAQAAEFFALLGGGKRDGSWDGSGMSNARLAVLPATTHYDIIMSPMLAPVVTSFLDAPMPDEKGS